MKKDIIKAIRLTWESLDSHLEGAVDKRLTGKVVGDRKFHKKCVEDYLFIIGVLTDQL